MVLNPQSPVPLYRQLADNLQAKIRSGEYGTGCRIPSEHELSGACGIGRPTARQAIDTLVRKGLLIRRRGSGTYVCEPQQEVDLFSLAGTSASFSRKGLRLETRMLQPVRREKVTGREENPFNEHDAYFFSRLTIVEGEPVLVEDLYLHVVLFKGLERIDLKGRSLSAIAESHYFLHPTNGKQLFRIDYAEGDRARLLKVTPETPLLMVQRFLSFPQRTNGVYAELWCRSDKFVFSQTIGGAVYV